MKGDNAAYNYDLCWYSMSRFPKASAVFDAQTGKLLGEVQRRSKPRIGKKKKEREDCQAGNNI